MQALARRQSQRAFSPEPLDDATLADLLQAAGGMNRPDLGGRTEPSAMNAQEVVLYAAMPQGLYRYEPTVHELSRVVESDVRGVTGYQDFVDDAALDLIYVADHGRMGLVPASQRTAYAFAAAGAMAQNVYLRMRFCPAWRPSCVPGLTARHWRGEMELANDEQLLLAQTVDRPRT